MVRAEITREATLGQLLDEIVAKCPDNDAIVYADRDYRQTWREFSDTIDRVAKGLMALGVQKGEKVAVWATNVPHWVTLQYATARIGAILLTINVNYKISEIEYVLKQSETENIFIIDGYRDTDYIATIYELVPELKVQPREHLRSEKFPHLKRVLFLGPEKHRGMYSMNEVMAMSVQTSDREYQEGRPACPATTW
jgi:fatty-acyl-CoA synthase